MVPNEAPLKGKNVGVIGYNARPIAQSAKNAGATVFVSDYWGDEDLSATCENWIAVLAPTPGSRQRQPLDMPLPVTLVDNLMYLTKEIELDIALIGSGFDDFSEAIEPLHEMGLIVGCTPARIRKARDFQLLKKLAQKADLRIPERKIFTKPAELISASASFEFPCVVRPTHSGGGSGIRIARNQNDIIDTFGDIEDEEFEPRIVQEYISGLDVSCSVLSSKDRSLSISVQGQLIGMPTSGRNCGFAYCGNYIPSPLSPDIVSKIMNSSEEISTSLNLRGSIGLDFVVDKSNEIWLMEVNPRIQGSLELLELVGNVSITELHVRAANGVLPERRPAFLPGIKMVVYSRRRGKVPDLSQYPNTVDRTPPGVIVNLGDPICTVIETGMPMKQCYQKAIHSAYLIQSGVYTNDE